MLSRAYTITENKPVCTGLDNDKDNNTKNKLCIHRKEMVQ